jgi:hypothetical protein
LKITKSGHLDKVGHERHVSRLRVYDEEFHVPVDVGTVTQLVPHVIRHVSRQRDAAAN